MSKNPFLEHSLDSQSFESNALEKSPELFDANMRQNFENILSRYPDDQRQSGIIPMLILTQVHNGGHLTDRIIEGIAEYLNVKPIAIYEVATFYSLFNHKPQGKIQIDICQGVSCLLCGLDEVVRTIEQTLKVSANEVTPDGLFSFKLVECLGDCSGAPMMRIGDEYIENLNSEKVVNLLRSYQQKLL